MIIADQHVHTEFSADSETPVEDQIKRAIEVGLKYICITDHHDFDAPLIPPDNLIFLIDGNGDPTRYFARLKELKEKYVGQIEVLTGVELGLQRFIGEKLEDFYSKYSSEFDCILASAHCFNGLEVGDQRVYEGRSYDGACRQFFAEQLASIMVYKDFDVLGHMDFIFRHIPGGLSQFQYKDFADVLDAILMHIIRYDIGLEINTTPFSIGKNEPNPNLQILKRYVELGGKILTFGSDAHTTTRIGDKFSVVEEMVKDCGIKEYAVFKNRKPIFLQI